MTSKIDVNFSEKQSELSAVLESREFQRSPALARLLKYLCEKTFQGKIHEIKEFSIATEVFGKDQNFGDRRDSWCESRFPACGGGCSTTMRRKGPITACGS